MPICPKSRGERGPLSVHSLVQQGAYHLVHVTQWHTSRVLCISQGVLYSFAFPFNNSSVKLYLLTTALSVSSSLDNLLHTYLKHSTMVTTYGCLVHRWYTFDGWKYWSILCVMMPFLKPKGYAVKYSDTNNGVKVKAAYLILPTRLITSKCATQPWEIALAAQFNKSMLSTYFWGCTAQLMPFPVNNLYALSFASTSSLCSKR